VADLLLYAKQQQFLRSDHGSDYYTRSSGVCVNCHSHQGFLARIASGSWEYPGDYVEDAMPMNCRTCHQIHTTYTSADFAFTVQGPVSFFVGNQSLDLGPAANLCASCHQQRERTGQMPAINGPAVTITSTHWGPHGSPQGNMFGGFGFYDFEGGLGGMSSHGTDPRSRGCPTCHMADTPDLSTGGHTYVPSTEGCETCHTPTDNFDKFGGQTVVRGLMNELGEMLHSAGIAHFDDGEWHPVPGTYPGNVAAAAWNLFGVQADGSLGVHNPHYIVGLLRGSIEKMEELNW